MINSKGRSERSIIDQVYHSLRVANTELSIDAVEALGQMARHLLSKDGDYPALLNFLTYYGNRYILDDVVGAIKGLRFDRIVELGAGTGWLSSGLGKEYGVDTIQTDSRKWPGIEWVVDVETTDGLAILTRNLKSTDLVIMCDVIHCINVEKRLDLMDCLSNNDAVILEYLPERISFMRSYSKQIRAKGCAPVNRDDMLSIRQGRQVSITHTPSHEIYIYRKEG